MAPAFSGSMLQEGIEGSGFLWFSQLRKTRFRHGPRLSGDRAHGKGGLGLPQACSPPFFFRRAGIASEPNPIQVMYKVIGADGAEYGPFSIEQVRDLIHHRRADAGSRVKHEGGGDWRPLSEYPEFAEALSQAASGASPSGGATVGDLDYMDLIKRSWSLFKEHWQLLFGANAIVALLAIGLEFLPVVGQIAGFILLGPLFTGVSWMSLMAVRGKPVLLADGFAGFGPRFFQLVLCGMVHQILLAVGFVLLVIPGIFLLVAWTFPYLLIMDRDLHFWDAMELSRKTVQPRWFHYFGIWMIVLLFVVVGLAACGVGLLITLPVVNIMIAVAYQRQFDESPLATSSS